MGGRTTRSPGRPGPGRVAVSGQPGDGVGFLESRGFTTEGQQVYAVRRLDLHQGAALFDRLHDEARIVAGAYELVRVVGPTPEDLLGGMVALHEDTDVVRSHRGHRLGLLLKCDMLRWIAAGRCSPTGSELNPRRSSSSRPM